MVSAEMSSMLDFVEGGIEAAGGIENGGALDGAQAGNIAVVAEDLARSAGVVQNEAFFSAFAHFNLVGGHLLAALEADNVNFGARR